MNLSLKGKKALVCGSTQGIGKASALELASLGANVTLMARNEALLKTVVSELPSVSGKHDYLIADFSKPDYVGSVVHSYLSSNSGFDILINNTGGPPGGPIIDANFSSFREALEMHLHCNHILVQALVPHMKKKEFGRIINIISTSVKMPIPGLGVSNTVRGAVASWAKTLSLEISQYGITVNNVLPGFTKTARLDQIIQNKAAKLNQSEDEVTKSMISEVPARRFGTANEVAAAVAFLATEAAAYINGVSIPVDGGRTGAL